MDVADITTTRPEPFRREQRPEGWCIVDARGGLVAVFHGDDAPVLALVLCNAMAIAPLTVKVDEEHTAEDQIDELERDLEHEREELANAETERNGLQHDLDEMTAERDRLRAELDERDGAPAAAPIAPPPTGTQTGFDLSKLVEKRP